MNSFRDFPVIRPRRPRQTMGNLLQILLQYFSDQTPEIKVVQVGANDGKLADPIRNYWAQSHWSGALFEPHPIYFSELSKRHGENSRLSLYNYAVSQKRGHMDLFHISETAAGRFPRWLRGCASLDRDRMSLALASASQSAGVEYDEVNIAQRKVDVARLDELLTPEDLAATNLLVIDVEGHETDVLSSFDIEDMNLKLAIVECNGGYEMDEKAIVAQLNRAGLSCFRLNDDIAGIRLDSILVPAETLLHFVRAPYLGN